MKKTPRPICTPLPRGAYKEGDGYVVPASPRWSAKRYEQITGHPYEVPEDARFSERPWRMP